MFSEKWKKEIFTIPNLLSVLRIALIPVYISLYLSATKKTDYLVWAGADGKPLFYDSNMEQYQLLEAEGLENGVNWLRYVRG